MRPGAVTVALPISIAGHPEILHRYLAASITALLASLTLPRTIRLDFALPPHGVFHDLLGVIYGTRGIAERGHIIPAPTVTAPPAAGDERLQCAPERTRAVLCWSGGVDSTYAYLLLKKNGYAVDLLHSDINQDQSIAERGAVRRLARTLHVRVAPITVSFPALKTLGRRYSEAFADPPAYNAIPFGRDVLHTCAAMYLAYARNARYICFGYEREVWEHYLYAHGKRIGRYDLQSEEGCMLLDRLVKTAHPDLNVFSPVASLSKLRMYQTLARFDSTLLANTASCYFGDRCGQCVNCYLYRALARLTDGVQGSRAELDEFLRARTMVREETFAEVLYLYFYDAIRSARTDAATTTLLRQTFGDALLAATPAEVRRELHAIRTTRLTPRGFRHAL